MRISPQTYRKMADQAVPPSRWYVNLPAAFCSGGAICMFGQLLRTGFQQLGYSEDQAGLFVSAILIFITAVLTGLGVFDKIARFAGAGTFVPITGFANAMVSPALEFRSEGMILGLGSKMFSIAGGVIVYGISASMAYGFLYWIYTLFSKTAS